MIFLRKSVFKFFLIAVFIGVAVVTSTVISGRKSQEAYTKYSSNSNMTDSKDLKVKGRGETETEVLGETLKAGKTQDSRKAVKIKNRVLLGIVVEDYANRAGTLTSLEEKLGVKIATVSIFKQFGPYNNRLVLDDLAFIKNSGKKLMISWEPWNPSEGPNQSRDFLKEIVNGQQDFYIHQFAEDIKNYGGQVLLRFGHEMNGNWYPWGRRPGDYKSAYIRIFEAFRNEDVKNIDFVWSVNSESLPGESISVIDNYYPGNTYVDLVGIDGFNYGTSQSWSSWRSFSSIFSPSYNYIISKYQKPVIISETASGEGGGNKAEWVKDMFSSLNSHFLTINEVVWFDIIKETDWRIDSTPSSLQAFQEAY